MVVSSNGSTPKLWLILENPRKKMDDLGVPPFKETRILSPYFSAGQAAQGTRAAAGGATHATEASTLPLRRIRVASARAECLELGHDKSRNGSFLKWGYPHGWMVSFMEKPIYRWMMTGGTPMTQETSKRTGYPDSPWADKVMVIHEGWMPGGTPLEKFQKFGCKPGLSESVIYLHFQISNQFR